MISKFQYNILSRNHNFTIYVRIFVKIGVLDRTSLSEAQVHLLSKDQEAISGGQEHAARFTVCPFPKTGYKFSVNSRPLTTSGLPHGSKHMPCTPQAHWATRLFMGLGREVFVRVFSHSLCDSTHCDSEQ